MRGRCAVLVSVPLLCRPVQAQAMQRGLWPHGTLSRRRTGDSPCTVHSLHSHTACGQSAVIAESAHSHYGAGWVHGHCIHSLQQSQLQGFERLWPIWQPQTSLVGGHMTLSQSQRLVARQSNCKLSARSMNNHQDAHAHTNTRKQALKRAHTRSRARTEIKTTTDAAAWRL